MNKDRRWWRVCLDEAQMVESTTAKAAEMALRLHAVHRYIVYTVLYNII